MDSCVNFTVDSWGSTVPVEKEEQISQPPFAEKLFHDRTLTIAMRYITSAYMKFKCP